MDINNFAALRQNIRVMLQRNFSAAEKEIMAQIQEVAKCVAEEIGSPTQTRELLGHLVEEHRRMVEYRDKIWDLEA